VPVLLCFLYPCYEPYIWSSATILSYSLILSLLVSFSSPLNISWVVSSLPISLWVLLLVFIGLFSNFFAFPPLALSPPFALVPFSGFFNFSLLATGDSSLASPPPNSFLRNSALFFLAASSLSSLASSFLSDSSSLPPRLSTSFSPFSFTSIFLSVSVLLLFFLSEPPKSLLPILPAFFLVLDYSSSWDND